MPFFLFLWCSLDKLRQAKLLFFLFIQASLPPQWFPWGDTVRFVGVPGQNLSLSQYRVCFMANLSWKCHFHWVMSKASFPARVVLGCLFVSFFTQFYNLLTCWRKPYFNWNVWWEWWIFFYSTCAQWLLFCVAWSQWNQQIGYCWLRLQSGWFKPTEILQDDSEGKDGDIHV